MKIEQLELYFCFSNWHLNYLNSNANRSEQFFIVYPIFLAEKTKVGGLGVGGGVCAELT